MRVRQAENKITGNRPFRRLKIGAASFMLLLAIQALALWSFYSYSQNCAAEDLLFRLGGWIGSFVFVPLCHISLSLLRFLMKSLFLAEFAILIQFDTIRIVLLVLHRSIISLLALCAC